MDSSLESVYFVCVAMPSVVVIIKRVEFDDLFVKRDIVAI